MKKLWYIFVQIFWLVGVPFIVGFVSGFVAGSFGWMESNWFIVIYTFIVYPFVLYWCIIISNVTAVRALMPNSGYVLLGILGTVYAVLTVLSVVYGRGLIVWGGNLMCAVFYFYGIFILKDLWKRTILSWEQEALQIVRDEGQQVIAEWAVGPAPAQNNKGAAEWPKQ